MTHSPPPNTLTKLTTEDVFAAAQLAVVHSCSPMTDSYYPHPRPDYYHSGGKGQTYGRGNGENHDWYADAIADGVKRAPANIGMEGVQGCAFPLHEPSHLWPHASKGATFRGGNIPRMPRNRFWPDTMEVFGDGALTPLQLRESTVFDTMADSKKRGRPSPMVSATKFGEGMTKRGQDGHLWRVHITTKTLVAGGSASPPANTHRWVRWCKCAKDEVVCVWGAGSRTNFHEADEALYFASDADVCSRLSLWANATKRASTSRPCPSFDPIHESQREIIYHYDGKRKCGKIIQPSEWGFESGVGIWKGYHGMHTEGPQYGKPSTEGDSEYEIEITF